MSKVKRYLLFALGLFISAFGVDIITKANLGTSPMSSIPYVMSLHFKPTMGSFTIYLGLLLVVLQLLILRRNFKLEHLLQIPLSFLFGYCIDFAMLVLDSMNPQAYVAQVGCLLLGCLVLGAGVFLEVEADVAMLPAESFVRAVSTTWHIEFGTVKIGFDITLTAIAAVMSLVFSGKLLGIREGTAVAAVLVGYIARTISRLFRKRSHKTVS